MLRRITAMLVAVLLTVMCSQSPLVNAADVEMSNGVIIQNEAVHRQIEQLMNLRATLALDFDSNAEMISRIDEELMSLGVEKLSTADLLAKLGDAAPMVVPADQQYEVHFSERVVTVWNGDWYEVQIITSAPTDKRSDLCPMDGVNIQSDEQQVADQFELVNVLANGVISFVDGGKLSAVVNTVSAAFTFYDICNGLLDAISRTTVIEGVSASAAVALTIQEKFFFIKSYGAVDEGNQFLVCASNHVEYEMSVSIEEGELVDGIYHNGINDSKQRGSFSSQYYDNDAAINRAAQICWNCRHYGDYDFPIHFRVSNLTITALGGECADIDIPYNGLFWTF